MRTKGDTHASRVEVASGVSFEANKAAAKDSDRSIGDRVGHGENHHKERDSTIELLVC